MEHQNKPYRFVIYIGTSSIGSCPTLNDQERLLVEMAEREELNIVETYRESKSSTHPKFFQALETLEEQKADALLIFDLSVLPKTILSMGVLLLAFDENYLAQIKTFDDDFYHNTIHRKKIIKTIFR